MSKYASKLMLNNCDLVDSDNIFLYLVYILKEWLSKSTYILLVKIIK